MRVIESLKINRFSRSEVVKPRDLINRLPSSVKSYPGKGIDDIGISPVVAMNRLDALELGQISADHAERSARGLNPDHEKLNINPQAL